MFPFLKLLNSLHSITPQGTISVHKGSCLRQRYKKSECQHCFTACPSGALSWAEGELSWNEKLCQGCLLCTAVCPMGALNADDVSLRGLLKKLQGAERPVLACHRQAKAQGHARISCLGLCADPELLMTWSLALKKPLKLNMTQCRNCQHQHIIEHLETAVRMLPKGFDVFLVFSQKELDFQDRQCDRREFLSLLQPPRKSAPATLADQLQIPPPPANYRSPRLPVSRSLLLQVIELFPENKGLFSEHYWPQAYFTESCKGCHACASVCPTGALSRPEMKGSPPAFNPQHCVSCGVCEEFCRQASINIS